MTKRFDRTVLDDGCSDKVHMQSFAELRHYDFNDPEGYSHVQALLTIDEMA